MKLKEKFNNALDLDNDKYIVLECEKIADEFAIGFAEWLYKWDNTRLPNGNWIIGLGLKAYTSKELLEIYKRENNL